MRAVEYLAFDTIGELKKAHRIEDVCNVLSRVTMGLGFNCFLITGVPHPGETLAQHVVLSGWSSEWMQHYNGNGYVHIDPVANQIRRSTRPFIWSDLDYDARRHSQAHLVMMEAQDCGMRNGYTVPIYGHDGYQACVTMGGDPEISERELDALHLISMFAYSMARELDPRFKAKLKKGTPPLTERETEVLKWTSIGKTGWEIGAILGISRRTVEFHLRSIADKFDVVNRTHAVAQALRVGLIN